MVVQTLRDFFADLAQKDYKDMTPAEAKKASRIYRIKQYKVICFCGVALLMWRDNVALLNKVYLYSHTAAYICSLYFTFALVSMLFGVIASTFPNTAPCAMTLSWNGALQSFLFTIALIHLNMMEFYTEVLHMFISFLLTSALFSIYWYFCAQDPMESSSVNIKER